MADDKTWREKVNGGGIYDCTEAGFAEEQLACLEKLYDFNQTRPGEEERRRDILRDFFGSGGGDIYIEPPLHANWGRNTHWGGHCYANFGLTLVDDADIHIGSGCMFGPHVTIATAGHPIWPERRWSQYSIPVTIGNNVWLGAQVVVLPGVHIGDNSVIGAGSIVTKDIPANVIAVGNPCRVLRPIGEHDREYYFKDMKFV